MEPLPSSFEHLLQGKVALAVVSENQGERNKNVLLYLQFQEHLTIAFVLIIIGEKLQPTGGYDGKALSLAKLPIDQLA